MNQKQVDKEHYDFGRYLARPRWNSLWNQLDEVKRLAPESVLEIGPGPGVFKANAQVFGLNIETVDIDPELNPDHLASVTDLPFADNSYDLVCAFQVLEHMPYEETLKAFAEMVRVSRKNVVLSLPDALKVWCFRIDLPGFATHEFMMRKPFWKPVPHEFDGQHYWELNKQDHPLERVVTDLQGYAKLTRSYQLFQNPYHHFFIFEKQGETP